MIFDSEQMTVRGASSPRDYFGVVRNTVEVIPHSPRKWPYEVHIVVPSALFCLFTDVFHYTPEDLRERPICFFLTEYPDKRWVFGFDRGEDSEADSVLLWPYSKLPGWGKKKA